MRAKDEVQIRVAILDFIEEEALIKNTISFLD